MDMESDRSESGQILTRPEYYELERALIDGMQRIWIVGAPGSGKTSLAKMAVQFMGSLFPGGILYSSGRDSISPDELLTSTYPGGLSGRALLVIDDADGLSFPTQRSLEQISAAYRLLTIILVSRPLFRWNTPLPRRVIRLRPLGLRELSIVLNQQGFDSPEEAVRELVNALGPNPHLILDAATLLRSGKISFTELLTTAKGFRYSGIVGPDGIPLSEADFKRSLVLDHVQHVNDRLLEMVRQDPQQLYSLTPRQFEEVVAEILARLGYDVQLTPESNDGGFDIVAAKQIELGRFLFLVECKRYTPEHRVGVEVVRSLYGTVNQRQAAAGVVATTSSFTRGAHAFQQSVENRLSLKDLVGIKGWLANLSVSDQP